MFQKYVHSDQSFKGQVASKLDNEIYTKAKLAIYIHIESESIILYVDPCSTKITIESYKIKHRKL